MTSGSENRTCATEMSPHRRPSDLHDAAEIDAMLSLRTLTLTNDNSEKSDAIRSGASAPVVVRSRCACRGESTQRSGLRPP